jgi:hypothetical protein
MYDAIANLCQNVAHEIMIECCNLSWITICNNNNDRKNDNDDGRNGGESKVQQQKYNIIRALVGTTTNKVDESKCSNNISSNKDTNTDILLIITGKGKVRSGIFSRHHILTSGLEPGTALPLIQMANQRNMKCIIIDPNARGDDVGMDTFDITLRTLFEPQPQSTTTSANNNNNMNNGSIYILAHSAGGGLLVRYLLAHPSSTLVTRIRCIVFTDSTHNVQWIKTKQQQQQQGSNQSLLSTTCQTILSLITSPSVALYIRSANKMYIDNWSNLLSGDECTIVDEYWIHRFGSIKTVWAGTTDHSLSNWTSMKVIWEHIDRIRTRERERINK